MKNFIKISMILGLSVIVLVTITFQSDKLRKRKEKNQEIQEKQQQEILDICRINKVMKIYSQNDGESFYVVLENKNIYKVDEDMLGNYTIGEYCK
ncbi:hypothetical protein [Leptotrichia wadei]|jgi:hypothetical protein|uniref:Uncharacterized protein n=1 Tax=Leptotrichia wadei TaxID=157687 RepID=A0A510KF18_9FUSO|nr:hypothetical protein [Leptotrichia wadei]BBM50280.1 hypothetical protein JMUB3934_1578 [Leptotrichia wadei]